MSITGVIPPPNYLASRSTPRIQLQRHFGWSWRPMTHTGRASRYLQLPVILYLPPLVRRSRTIHPRAYARARRSTVLILACPLGASGDRQQRHVVDRLRARCPTTPAMTSTPVELAPSSEGPREPRLGGRPRARVTAVVTRAHSPNAAITCAGYRPVFFSRRDEY